MIYGPILGHRGGRQVAGLDLPRTHVVARPVVDRGSRVLAHPTGGNVEYRPPYLTTVGTDSGIRG